jgi:solute carrier family 25 iron transporter 28/37
MTVCVRRLMREGMCAPWKGSGTVLIGCIPAHAAYFSIYESLKLRLSTAAGSNDHPLAASAAVAVAAVVHDSIMTPMDVMKQRLQVGASAAAARALVAGCAVPRSSARRAEAARMAAAHERWRRPPCA